MAQRLTALERRQQLFDARAQTQTYAAVSRVVSLTANSSSISDLKHAFCSHPNVGLLGESEVVTLLLQSLVLSGDIDAERLKAIIDLFEDVSSSTGGSDVLAKCGAVETLTAALSHLPQADMVITILKIVTTVARKSSVDSPVRHAALNHVLSFMYKVEQRRRENPSWVVFDDVNFYRNLGNALIALRSGTTIESVAVPQLPYSAVSGFVPMLIRIVRRWFPSFGVRKYVRVALYSTLHSLFQCDTASASDGSAEGGNETDDAQRRRDLAEFTISDHFEPLLQLSDFTTL